MKSITTSVLNCENLSQLSNKTYVQHLQKQLEEEKQARLKLQRELEELRKLSSEITSHLGMKPANN